MSCLRRFACLHLPADQVHAALDVQLARYMAAGALPMAPPLHPEL
jgi:hypothetical protein